MQRVSFREKFPQPGRRSDAHQCSQHFCFLDRRALVHQILFTRRLKDRDKGLTLFMPKEEKVPSDTGGFKSAEGKKKRWSVSWTLVPWNNPLLNTFIYEFTPENTFLLLWSVCLLNKGATKMWSFCQFMFGTEKAAVPWDIWFYCEHLTETTMFLWPEPKCFFVNYIFLHTHKKKAHKSPVKHQFFGFFSFFTVAGLKSRKPISVKVKGVVHINLSFWFFICRLKQKMTFNNLNWGCFQLKCILAAAVQWPLVTCILEIPTY